MTLKRRGEIQWQSLTSQVDLGSGDIVRTGATGRVEMLLNPGSYLRAAENSEFELTNASLDVLQVKLLRGSVIVEVAGADEARTFIEVTTPQTKVAIDRKGLYRTNLVQDGTEVLVRKGRATVSGYASLTTELKDGRKILVSGGVPVVTKFDKKEQDTFDLWSQQRAETLVASNRRLPNSAIARSYATYSNSGFGLRRGYRSSGLWVYDPFFRGRTFLPFYTGWSSPYGHGYSHGFGFPGTVAAIPRSTCRVALAGVVHQSIPISGATTGTGLTMSATDRTRGGCTISLRLTAAPPRAALKRCHEPRRVDVDRRGRIKNLRRRKGRGGRVRFQSASHPRLVRQKEEW